MAQTIQQLNFREASTDEAETFVSRFQTLPIHLSFDQKTNKKIIYRQTERTLKNPHMKWENKLIQCGTINNLSVVDTQYVENFDDEIMLLLFDEAIFCVKTRVGFHFYFQFEPSVIFHYNTIYKSIIDSNNAIAPNSKYFVDNDIFTYKLFVKNNFDVLTELPIMSDKLLRNMS